MHPTRIPSRFRLRPITAAILFGGAFGALPFQSALAQAAPADAASAPEGTAVLPQITVTGAHQQGPRSPKYMAPLLDTPQTISVIPEAIFREQGAQDLTDVLTNTPGISFSAGENGFGSNTNNFSMRGFDSSGNIFIDGVRDSGNYSRDVFNTEQVEVIKGPAADNGRSGAGGYINLSTKAPRLEDRYDSNFSVGFDEYHSDERLRGTLDMNKVLADGTAGRVNLLLQDGGVAGREEVEKKTLGFAPSIGFGLDRPTRFVLGYQYLKSEDLPDWGVPAAFVDGTVREDSSLDEDERDLFYGLSADYDDTDSHALLGRIEHHFSNGLTLSNQLRWSQTERDARYVVPTGYDSATRLVTTQMQRYARENTNVSNLSNLSYAYETGHMRHYISTGLEITRETSEADRFGTADAGSVSVTDPDPGRVGPATIPAATQTGEADIRTVAAYVYKTIEFNEHWQINAGVRAEHYEVELDSRNVDGTPTSMLDGYDFSETTVGGKFGVVYKPAPNGSVYAAIGVSSLPPASFLSNPDISRTGDNAFPGSTGQNNEDAKIQRAVNYEVGTKWELFDGRLSTSLAAFRTERRRVAITGIEGDEEDATLKGYGKQIVEGIELSASGRITPAWSLLAGVGFLDSERRHSAFLDEARCRANPGDYQSGAAAAACPTLILENGTAGDELSFTPRFSANLWTTYRFASSLTLGAGLKHVDESWAGRPDDADRIIPNGGPLGNAYGKLPDYTVFNAMASYDVTPKIRLRLNVDNLTDEVYATSGNWGMNRVFLGDPRSFILSADVRF